jgi:hypothetical protein
MYKTVSWNTGHAAERARHNLKLKKKKAGRKLQATSSKRQAPSKKYVDSHKIPDIKDL